jgi:nucleoside-diphosphate-sugar epimerase
VCASSSDVYRAYGRLTRIEPGATDRETLTEDAPLRTVLFPYRARAQSPQSLEYWYEKILAENAVLSSSQTANVVLRLRKVYGPGNDDDLATVCRYRHHPAWRWTHGYVENVAAAVVLTATAPITGNRIYNIGEAATPTIAERLATMPASNLEPDVDSELDFSQDIAYDTTRIRAELGYRETVEESEARLLTLQSRMT